MKQFVVAAHSSATNSFGLRGVILVARDGEAWEIGVNYLHLCQCLVGKILELNTDRDGIRVSHDFHFELPKKLPDAPPKVADEVWSIFNQ